MSNESLKSSLRNLSPKLRIYVQCRLEGMTQIASATAAGSKSPRQDATIWEKREDVQAAIIAASDAIAEEVGFTRKEAHDMLMQAYYNAETATEQIAAVRELVNLHAVAKPKVVKHEHEHNHQHQLEHMPTEELMKIAGMDGLLLEGEYEVVREDDEDQALLQNLRD